MGDEMTNKVNVKIPGISYAREDMPGRMAPGVDSGIGVPPIQSSNLGAETILAAPSSLFDANGRYVPITPAFRLLNAGPEYLRRPGGPGTWVLSLTANYVFPNGVPVAGTYGSVVARVYFGSGGVQQYIDVDPWNTRLQVPSEKVVVDVFWESLGYSPSFGPINVFPVRVSATLERAGAYTPSLAPIKSYWVLEVDSGTLNAVVPIPPFASAYNFCPMQPTAVGTSPLAAMGANIGADDFVQIDVIESMARMNQFRALPPASKSILATAAAFPFQYPGRVQFQLNG